MEREHKAEKNLELISNLEEMVEIQEEIIENRGEIIELLIERLEKENPLLGKEMRKMWENNKQEMEAIDNGF